MKKLVLILIMLNLLSCNKDDSSVDNFDENQVDNPNDNKVEITEIETIINDITTNNNVLDGTDVTIEGFLKFYYSLNVTTEECNYPCENYTCNYESSNEYLVRDTYGCPGSNKYEISDTENNYEKAIKLSFSGVDDIDLLKRESDCEGVSIENYPITISGKLKYGTANNHELMLEQKSAIIIIDESTIALLNDVLTCTDK